MEYHSSPNAQVDYDSRILKVWLKRHICRWDHCSGWSCRLEISWSKMGMVCPKGKSLPFLSKDVLACRWYFSQDPTWLSLNMYAFLVLCLCFESIVSIVLTQGASKFPLEDRVSGESLILFKLLSSTHNHPLQFHPTCLRNPLLICRKTQRHLHLQRRTPSRTHPQLPDRHQLRSPSEHKPPHQMVRTMH